MIKFEKKTLYFMFVSVFCHGHDICGYSNTNEHAIIIWWFKRICLHIHCRWLMLLIELKKSLWEI